MKNIEQISLRISSGRIKAEDIKHKDRLTDDQIANIPVENVYCWTRTGEWNGKDFKKWCRVMCVID